MNCSDSTTDLMVLFSYLRTQFQAAGFKMPFFQTLALFLMSTLSLCRPQIHVNREIADWSDRPFWVNLHRDSYSLHRVLSVSLARAVGSVFLLV
jgi:hypothetical protein